MDDSTIWRTGKPTSFNDLSDGSSKTIALIEVAGRGVPWYEPRDLTMEEAIDLLCGETKDGYEWIDPGFFMSKRLRSDGLHPRVVAFADGHAKSVGYFRNREEAKALLTCAGEEESADYDDLWEYPETIVIGHIIHWGRIWGLTAFLVLAFAPVFWRREAVSGDA